MTTKAASARARRAFEKLSSAEQRVAIAKDVIAQLDAERFEAAPGTYVEFSRGARANKERQVCELTAGRTCEVCALGALFVAGVERADKLRVKDLVYGTERGVLRGLDGNDCRAYLERFFEYDQLAEIESAFECWGAGLKTRWRLLPPDERMRRIMANIIKNYGEFVPDELSGAP